jgi:hypothetical protein
MVTACVECGIAPEELRIAEDAVEPGQEVVANVRQDRMPRSAGHLLEPERLAVVDVAPDRIRQTAEHRPKEVVVTSQRSSVVGTAVTFALG